LTRKEYDKLYSGYVGVDEAGRGTAAGELIFVGVKLKDTSNISDIAWADDSKKTKHEHRVAQAKKLKPHLDYCIVKSSAYEIDKYGLSYCIKKSLQDIKEHFPDTPIIYDGNTSYKVEDIETLVKGDSKVSLIAAASIFAKLIKDMDAKKMHEDYPEYGFDGHSGYVNAKHTQAIIDHGYCKYHRKSYNIKKLLEHDIGINVKDK
jgi:ribonuclease HII